MPQGLRSCPLSAVIAGTASLLIAGCIGLSPDASDEGASCRQASDCEDICSPVGECVFADSALDIRVSWTINGVAPTPTAPSPCGRIADFELRFESASTRDAVIAYFPVPCENGTVFYPDMPSRLVQIRLIGIDEFGATVAQETREIVDTQSALTIDFAP